MKKQMFQGVLLGLSLLSLSVSANPTGGSVAAGSASIGGEGTPAVTVQQNSNTAIINWQSFSINSGESTTFLQPNAQSAVLNRVLGGETSIIDGTLKANGQVYLINGNGILVGPGGAVNTNAFVASTRDITDGDFLSGNLHFTGTGATGVQNQGTITALGGNVVLIGKTVNNQGVISAANGTAGLVAGDDVLLAQKNADGSTIKVSTTASPSGASGQVGVSNSGAIKAAAAELKAANGNIYALAIQNKGTIRATTVAKQGGHIWLTTDNGSLVNSGTLDASASAAGGKGGSIETSGASVIVGGTVTGGKGGTWLIDPVGPITISTGVASATNFNTTTLDNSLSGGTNVSISAVGGATDTGDIDVNNAVSWTGAASLTLSAERNINVDAGITSDSGAVNLVADSTGTGVGTVAFGNGAQVSTSGAVKIFYNPTNPNGTVASTVNATEYTTPTDFGGDVTGGATLTSYMLVNNVYDLQNMQNNLSGSYAQGKNINASATGTWNATTTGSITIDEGFIPVGTAFHVGGDFTGDFNGNGFTIDQLVVRNPNTSVTSSSGLFGAADGGTLENITLTNIQVSGFANVGGLVGISSDTITKSSTSGSVTALTGTSSFSSAEFGGLVGTSSGVISFSSSSVNVSAPQSTDVGGLVGSTGPNGSASTISVVNCFATGSVNGAANVGGLIGAAEGAGANLETITDCYATGMVTCDVDDGGGLVGNVSSNVLVSQSYSTGAVVMTEGTQGGGLVGQNQGQLLDDYSTGSVSGSAPNVGGLDDGGLVGFNDGTITACYSTGHVSGVDDGGFVGDNEGTISSSFWDTSTSGFSSIAGGVGSGTTTGAVGATTAQLTSASFITANSDPGSWDFTGGTGVWGVNGLGNDNFGHTYSINNGLPYFQWQYPTVEVVANNQSVQYTGVQAMVPNSTDYTIDGDPNLLITTPTLSVSGIGINAGTSASITATALPEPGDAVEIVNGALTITKAPLTITASSGTITYKGNDFSGGFGATYSGFVNNQGVTSLLGTLSYTGSSQGALNVGSYTITPAGLTSNNYAITYAPGSLTINPALLTITANSVSETYNGTAFNSPTVTYVGLKGNDSASSVLTGNLSFSGSAIGQSNVGGYTIVPSGQTLTTNNYTLSYADGSLTISPAVLTLTVKAGSSIYGQNVASAYPVPGLTTTGLVGGDTVSSIGYSSVITGTNAGITSTTDAGSYKLTIDGSLTDGNYVLKSGTADPAGKTTTWSVTPDILTLSGLTGTSIYGQTPATPGVNYTLTSSNGVTNQATLLGLLSGAPTTTAYGFNITNTTNAGKINTDQITSNLTLASGVNAHDYTLKTVKQGVWTVTPDMITIAGLTSGTSTYGFTPGFNGATYFDVTDQDSTPDVTDLLQGTGATLRATASSNAGTYSVAVTGKVATGVTASDYKIVLTPGVWTVTPQAVNITIGNGISVYGSKPATPTLTAVGTVNGKTVNLTNNLLSGYSTDLVNVIGATGNAGVGQYSFSLAGAARGNYLASDPSADATWTISPATITAINFLGNAKSVYGSNPIDSELKVTGLVNGDKPDALGYVLVAPGNVSLSATTVVSATPYSFTIGGALFDDNYVLKAGVSPPINLTGKVTITPATLTVSALSGGSVFGTSPTYGNEIPGDFGFNVVGFVNGEDIASTDILDGFTESPIFTSTTAVGKYTIKVTKPLVLADPNYTVKIVNGTWSIGSP